MLKKRDSNSEEIAQVPPLKLSGPSPMRMEAHDLAKQEIGLIHCQTNDSRPTCREQYTINDTFANRRKLWVKSVDQVLLWHHSERRDSCRDLFWWKILANSDAEKKNSYSKIKWSVPNADRRAWFGATPPSGNWLHGHMTSAHDQLLLCVVVWSAFFVIFWGDLHFERYILHRLPENKVNYRSVLFIWSYLRPWRKTCFHQYTGTFKILYK